MAMLMAKEGMLCIADAYEERMKVKRMGAAFVKESSLWVMPLTDANVDMVLAGLKDPIIEISLENELLRQEEKMKRLNKIIRMSESDEEVRLRVPGLKIPLFNYQKLGVMFALANGEAMLLADEMGLGKALKKGTEVYTPTGYVPIEELKVGDEVIGKNGKATKVIGFYPQGKKQAYRVTFSDGASVECCDEHLWQVNTPTRKSRGNKPVVKSLREIVDAGLTRKNGKNGFRWNWYIPLVDPVQFKNRDPILDRLPPYIMGLLLGDGHLTGNSLMFSTADNEIIRSIEKQMGTDWKVRKCDGEYDYALTRKGAREAQLEPVHKYMRESGLKGTLSPDKWVPDEYLDAPVDDRLALLQGLMDSDGTVTKCERVNAAVYCTTSPMLRDDVIWLCQSLGGTATFWEKHPFYYDKDRNKVHCKTAWLVVVSIPKGMCPFRLKRKAKLYPNLRPKYAPTRAIVSVEKTTKEQMYCIAVDAPDKLYVTKDFIVTHNTPQSLAIALMLKYKYGIDNNLIIVPASLKWNWPIEIEKFTSERYVVIDGTPDHRIQCWLGNYETSFGKGGKIVYRKAKKKPFFYVVNFELILEDLFGGRQHKIKSDDDAEAIQRKLKATGRSKVRAERLRSVRSRVWDFLSVDEAHALAGHNSKRSSNTKSMRANFKLAMTGTPLDGKLEQLHSVFEFVKPGLFMSKTRFLQRHADFDFWGKVKKYKRISEVREKIRPYFLRRLKKDVLKDLPDKIYVNIYIELTVKEKKAYDSIADRTHECSEDAEALVRTIRCKQFCDHPELVGETMKSSKMTIFMDTVDELVSQNAEKVIIFSQYKQMLDLIALELKKSNIRFLRIDGDTDKRERAAMTQKFNEDPKIDAIIGTEAMSQGLNLQGASYVINYDDNWQPLVMRQREDRAHRHGQKNTVTVINFVCKDTIEERIRDVLYGKEVVSAEVLGDGTDETVLKRLGPQDIAKLL